MIMHGIMTCKYLHIYTCIKLIISHITYIYIGISHDHVYISSNLQQSSFTKAVDSKLWVELQIIEELD